ncbi:MAG: Gfo/Idh/MocA family protein [Candidatus Poribacteria bacterium]
MQKYRIGLVGCGGIAHSHINGYQTVAGELGEVVAGCDLNREILDPFCDRYDVPHRFTNVQDLINSGEVDVITLLTPPSVREEVIFPAAESGVHLLVEKPFAENIADAVSFVEAAERGGVVLAVSQQFRFMPEGSLLLQKRSATVDQATLRVHRLDGEIEQRDCSGENIFRSAIGESMRRLLLAVDTGTEPTHSGRDNLQTMSIVDAAYLSASCGEQVEIADVWSTKR